MRCLSHGKEFMDDWGNCLACEEIRHEEMEQERHDEECRELERLEMEEHFRNHPHG